MMNRKFEINVNKTYATESNADKAVAKAGFEDIRHFMMKTDDGRFYPVFVSCIRILYLVFCILYPVSCILYPVSCIVI